MDINGEVSSFTNSESLWLSKQNFLQADGDLDPEMVTIQRYVEATRVAAMRQTIAESGWTYYRERFGKDEKGNEQAVIEAPISRVGLEIILQHARDQFQELRHAVMGFDNHFADTVTVVDGSDPEDFKGMIFNQSFQDLQVTSGIVTAISEQIE